MHTLYAAMFDHLQLYHRQMEEVIDSLPAESFDWSPGADINSINVLVTHICGAQRYWIGSASRDPMLPRDRPTEFQVKGLAAPTLKADLAHTLSYCQQVLASLIPDDLTRPCAVLREGQPVTVGWALIHAVQHTALHVGQVQLMAQFWKTSH